MRRSQLYSLPETGVDYDAKTKRVREISYYRDDCEVDCDQRRLLLGGVYCIRFLTQVRAELSMLPNKCNRQQFPMCVVDTPYC